MVAAFGGKVFGVDRATGAVRWRVVVEEYGAEVEIAIEAGVVVACSSSMLTFVRYATGQVLRQVKLVGEYPRRPIMLVDQGQVLVARNGEVACYSLTGDPLWQQPFDRQGLGSVALGLPGLVRQADENGTR